MARHVFDVSETATHELVASQLRSRADQFAKGSIDLSYDEWEAPTVIVDPVEVVVDLKRKRHHVDLVIHLSWPLTAGHASS